jgi:hypothetical protein
MRGEKGGAVTDAHKMIYPGRASSLRYVQRTLEFDSYSLREFMLLLLISITRCFAYYN